MRQNYVVSTLSQNLFFLFLLHGHGELLLFYFFAKVLCRSSGLSAVNEALLFDTELYIYS